MYLSIRNIGHQTGLAPHTYSLLCSLFSLSSSSCSPSPLYTDVFQCIAGGHDPRHECGVKVDSTWLMKPLGVVLQRLVQSLLLSSDFTLSGLGYERTINFSLCIPMCLIHSSQCTVWLGLSRPWVMCEFLLSWNRGRCYE